MILDSYRNILGSDPHCPPPLPALMDDYARGMDTGIIDLVLVGNIDKQALDTLVAKAEKHIGRKVRVLCLTGKEYKAFAPRLDNRPQLILLDVSNGE